VDDSRVIPACLSQHAPQLVERFASGTQGASEHHAALVCFALAKTATAGTPEPISALGSTLDFARRAAELGAATDFSRLSRLAGVAAVRGGRKEAAPTLCRMAAMLQAGRLELLRHDGFADGNLLRRLSLLPVR
jgi:hypothetical protein